MRKETFVYLAIFSVSSIKNTFNKLFFFFGESLKKPFGGSSWLLIFFPLFWISMILFGFSGVGGCCAWGLLMFWAVGWGCCRSLSPLLLRAGDSAWRWEYRGWVRGGAGVCWVTLSR